MRFTYDAAANMAYIYLVDRIGQGKPSNRWLPERTPTRCSTSTRKAGFWASNCLMPGAGCIPTCWTSLSRSVRLGAAMASLDIDQYVLHECDEG